MDFIMANFVFGEKGFVGSRLVAEGFAKPANARLLSEKDAQDAFKSLGISKGDSAINCIGKTGSPNVDWCEFHKHETFLANTLVPYWLAKACESSGARLVHLSTGCIFQGSNNGIPFTEEDFPNYYRSFYSRSKAMAEDMLSEFPKTLILRLRMPVDSKPGPKNLITKLARYEKIISEENSITVVDDFINALKFLAGKNAEGVFNVVNPQPTTHRQIAELYSEIVDPSKKFSYFSLEELEKITAAKRSNCVLSCKKLENAGFKMRNTAEALRQCMIEYGKSAKFSCQP